jgi:hypothetical protein
VDAAAARRHNWHDSDGVDAKRRWAMSWIILWALLMTFVCVFNYFARLGDEYDEKFRTLMQEDDDELRHR